MNDIAEQDALQRTAADLIEEGFEVFEHPRAPLIPKFLGGYQPDLIAIRGDKRLVIEIKGLSPSSNDKIKKLAQLFQGQKDWEFRVVWIEPASRIKDNALPILSREQIRISLQEVRKLKTRGHTESALLLSWATFEAVARAMLPSRFGRPQTPGRVVEVLAGEGYITPSEADNLRDLAEIRNKFIHGGLQTKVDKDNITVFVEILEVLIKELPPTLT